MNHKPDRLDYLLDGPYRWPLRLDILLRWAVASGVVLLGFAATTAVCVAIGLFLRAAFS